MHCSLTCFTIYCAVFECNSTQQTLHAQLQEDALAHNSNNYNINNSNKNIDQLLHESSSALTSMQTVTSAGSVGVTPGIVTADNVTSIAELITGTMQEFALPKTTAVKSSSKAIPDVFAVDDSIDESSLRAQFPLARSVSHCC
jgi:hypothetical protein